MTCECCEEQPPIPDFSEREWNVPKLKELRAFYRRDLADNHKVRQRLTNVRVRLAWDHLYGPLDERRRAVVAAIEAELERRGVRA